MAITFALRTPYDVPNGRYVKRFRHKSVLSWFRSNWHNKTSIDDRLGAQACDFRGLFNSIEDENLPKPETMEQVAAAIKQHCYVTDINFDEHAIEVITDDDEMELTYYFFDDEYAKANQNRVAFLTHGRWLPQKVKTQSNSPRSKPDRAQRQGSCIWIFANFIYCTADSGSYDVQEVEGVRLDQFEKALSLYSKLFLYAGEGEEQATFEKATASVKSCQQFIEAYVENYTSEENPKTEYRLGNHVCELNFHADDWSLQAKDVSIFFQLIVVDDLWTESYPELFDSMLMFKHLDRKILFRD